MVGKRGKRYPGNESKGMATVVRREKGMEEDC